MKPPKYIISSLVCPEAHETVKKDMLTRRREAGRQRERQGQSKLALVITVATVAFDYISCSTDKWSLVLTGI